MKEKCKKYEGLFVFAQEQELLNHIQTCNDCRLEHEKMQRVSELIQEIKPYYKKNKFKKMQVASIFFIVLLGGIVFTGLNGNFQSENTLTYDLSAEELGFPTDDYGFIMVD